MVWYVALICTLFCAPRAAAAGLRARGSASRRVAAAVPVPKDALDTPENFPFSGDADFVGSYLAHLNISQQDSTVGLEEVLGAPPNASGGQNRTVVVAKYDEDVSWVKRLPKNYNVVVYQSKDPNGPNFVDNFGNEATKYLAYIVDNYDNLPDSAAFVQAGEQDWHDPAPKEFSLARWDWGRAGARGGFASLPTSAPCIVEDTEEQPTQSPLGSPKKLRYDEAPDEEECRAVGVVEHTPKQMDTVKGVWGSVFAPELGPLPQRWLTHCCAQFEVTRQAIQQHPKEFYSNILSWAMSHDKELLATDYGGDMRRNHDPQRRDAGHVFEISWALIFSDPMTRVVLPPKP